MISIKQIIDWTTNVQPTKGQRYYFADTISELVLAEGEDRNYGVFSHRIGNEYCLKSCKTGLPVCANYLTRKEG